MHWEVGLQVGFEDRQITVYPYQLARSNYNDAVNLAIEITRNEFPQEKIELNYIREYEICH